MYCMYMHIYVDARPAMQSFLWFYLFCRLFFFLSPFPNFAT